VLYDTSMKLTLSNFRCFSKKSIVIPDNGLILLSGSSGCGKSTIIQALIYTLYGKIKKPYSFGQSSCSVKLVIDDYTIIRTSTPNRIQLLKKSGSDFLLIAEDAEAQSIINKKYLSYEEFIICSYIPQKNNTCILSLPPTEQISIIEKLSFNEEQNNTIKLLLKDKIKALESTMNNIKIQLDFIKKEKDAMVGNYTLQVEDPLISSGYDYEYIVNLNDTYPQSIKKIENELNSLDMRISKYENNNKNYKKIEQQLQTKIHTKNLYSSGIKPGNIKREILSLTDLFNKSTAVKLKKTLWPTYSKEEAVNLLDKLISFIEPYKMKTKFEKMYQPKTLKELLTMKQNTTAKYNCPSCKVPVFINSSKQLEQFSADTTSSVDTVSITEQDIDEWVRILTHYDIPESLMDKISDLKKYISSNISIEEKCNIDTSEPELLKEPGEYNSMIKTLTTQYEKIKSEQLYRDKLGEEIQSLTLELSDLKVDTNIDSLPLQELIYQRDQAHRNLNRVHDMFSDNNEKLKKYREYEKYLQHKMKIDEWSQKEDGLNSELKQVSLELEGFYILKTKYTQAVIMSMQQTIQLINQHTEYFLSKFFTDNFTARLVSDIEDLKKIKVEITYKNNVYDNIYQLSGGEFDKCVLASICGVNSMMNSNIIILDESLASLDTDNNTDTFNLLKEVANDKLILVCSHEAVKGIFDTIITL